VHSTSIWAPYSGNFWSAQYTYINNSLTAFMCKVKDTSSIILLTQEKGGVGGEYLGFKSSNLNILCVDEYLFDAIFFKKSRLKFIWK